MNHTARQAIGAVSARLVAFVLLIGPASTAAAQPAPPPLPGNVSVVADALANPRGFTWGPDGALYVAESGTPPAGFVPPAGPPPPGAPPVINNNGRVVRIMPDGTRNLVADGLPVFVGPLGDTLGVANVAFIGNQLYVAISAGPKHGHPEMAGGIYRVETGGRVTQIADTDAYNIANPPEQDNHDEAGDELSNPYDMLAIGGKLYVTDGNKDVIHVVDPAAPAGNRISRLVDLSAGMHKVLTGLALGADGNLYASSLTPFPFPTGGGKVFQVTMSGEATEVAAGISAGTGLAIGPDGTFYVTEIGTTPGAPPFLVPPGRLVTATLDGTEPFAAPLFFPTIARWGPDGLYAAVGSVAGDTTGMIVRIDTETTMAGPVTTR